MWNAAGGEIERRRREINIDDRSSSLISHTAIACT